MAALATSLVVVTLLIQPAAAQAPQGQAKPACEKYRQRGDDASVAQCEYNEYMRRSNERIKDAEQRSAAARATSAKAKAETNSALRHKACADFLLAGVSAGKWTREAILQEAGGPIDDDNVCPLAGSKGFKPVAAAGGR